MAMAAENLVRSEHGKTGNGSLAKKAPPSRRFVSTIHMTVCKFPRFQNVSRQGYICTPIGKRESVANKALALNFYQCNAPTMTSAHCDIAVIGGGIAGLWALHRLKSAGYSAVLIESDSLGGAQTLASQGILHGGQKYNLGGKSDSITERLRDQPGHWLRCVAGEESPDLSGTKILSDHQLMWAGGGLIAATAAAVGVKTLEGQVEKLRGERPAVFEEIGFKGSIYKLHETILDIKSVVEALVKPVADDCYCAEISDFQTGPEGLKSITLRSQDETVELSADAFLFSAGSGNELAAKELDFPMPATQRRPLKQVMVRDVPWTLYGHCIQASPKPRATITTHPGGVWYMGGDIAEKSVGKSDEEAVRFAASELTAIFPGIDWSAYEFAAWDIDRAEPHTPSGKLPPDPVLHDQGNAALAWPTKLVLAPALADRALNWAKECTVPSGADADRLSLPKAPVGLYPWELATNWIRPK